MTPINEVIVLLKQIADHTSRSDSVYVAGISGGAALLGAAIGAIVTYFTGRTSAESQERREKVRLRTTVVTTERLRWLQDIRARSAHLLAQMEMQYSYLKRPARAGDATLQQKLDDFSTRVIEETNLICLMLNPNKTDQAALVQALQGAQQFMQECFYIRNQGDISFDDRRYATLKQDAFNALTSIGITTWGRIKQLE
jgi:hypothetical protein